MQSQSKNNQISRRRFLASTAALAGFSLVSGRLAYGKNQLSQVPRSEKGFMLGVITYSYRSMPHGAVDLIDWVKYAGLNSVEIMGHTLEEYAGAPEPEGFFIFRGRRHDREMREWRTSVSMDKFRELRRIYDNAGINIDITNLGRPDWSDEEIDYAFNVAKALGCRGITFEIGIDSARRMAPFAERHDMYAIMHNHGQPGRRGFSFEEHLAFSRKLMLNLDVGHYWGATGRHPNHVIEKFHDRIISLHIKDKTGPDERPADTNMPFGEGSTPLGDILRLLRDGNWPITADIELEYPVPQGSNAVEEVKKCADYCRRLLA
jgi:sugar phosphate isomerase/epimerase